MAAGVVRPGSYAEDDPPFVDMKSKTVRPPAKREAAQRRAGGEVPVVVGAPESTLPHAAPPDVPMPYGEARRIGVRAAGGAGNIDPDPAAGHNTFIQLAVGAAALWGISQLFANRQ